MKKTDKKIEDFWNGLEVRKPGDDRELQRRVVLGADAVVNTVARGFWRGIWLGIKLLLVFFLIGMVVQVISSRHDEPAKVVTDPAVSFLNDLRDAKPRPPRH